MKAYRCAHSGLLFPADYVKEWGTKYGKGMGPEPVSIVDDTMYHCEAAQAKRIVDVMHPARSCRQQVDLVEVPDDTPASAFAVLPDSEENCLKIRDILREKQLKNPLCDAKVLLAQKAKV